MSALEDWTDLIETTTTPAPRKAGGRPAKDRKSRQRKILCGSCGWIAYTTAGSLEAAGGLPSCACGGTVEVPNMRDRLAISFTEDDAVAELVGMTRQVRREVLTNAGWSREAISGFNDHYEPRPKAGEGKRANKCQWQGGYCHKYTDGYLCPEHAANRWRIAA